MGSLNDQIPGISFDTHQSDDYQLNSISAKAKLSSWSDFEGSNLSGSGEKEAAGHVVISIGSILEGETPVLTETHVNTYDFLIQNQQVVKDSILQYLLEHYPGLQEQYDYDEVYKALMPDVNGTDDFKNLIRLTTVHILDVEKEGMAYTGYQFHCTWDEEHGLGFMLHKDRIIEMGGADSSFLEWIAEKDLDPDRVNAEIEANYKLAEEQYKERVQKKKPWWKFW